MIPPLDGYIQNSDIVAIFDIDNSTVSKITRSFLSRAENRRRLTNEAGSDIPKYFIVTDKNEVILTAIRPKDAFAPEIPEGKGFGLRVK